MPLHLIPHSANLPSQRNRRDRRPAHPRPMRETERDGLIVRLVYDYRILTQGQIERLLGKRRSTVQQALVRLYHHRYLERVFLPVNSFGSSPTFYILDRQGIGLLRRLGLLDFTGLPGKGVSPMFLAHTLAINEFRITMTQAVVGQRWTISTWKTENKVKAEYDRVNIRTSAGSVEAIPILPDSYFVIGTPQRGCTPFCLELDRGRMSLKRFKTKVQGYVAYYKSGGYEKRYGTSAFRVLTVVAGVGEGRLKYLNAMTATVPGVGRRFWFAHLDHLLQDNPLTTPVWTVAGSSELIPLFGR